MWESAAVRGWQTSHRKGGDKLENRDSRTGLELGGTCFHKKLSFRGLEGGWASDSRAGKLLSGRPKGCLRRRDAARRKGSNGKRHRKNKIVGTWRRLSYNVTGKGGRRFLRKARVTKGRWGIAFDLAGDNWKPKNGSLITRGIPKTPLKSAAGERGQKRILAG